MNGPTAQTTYSCNSCQFLRSEYYSEPDDSDWDYEYYCDNPSARIDSKPKFLGYSTRTPDWCPYRLEAGFPPFTPAAG